MSPIRILIAEDHPFFRRGLRHMCITDPELVLVGEAENGLQAVEMARQLKPDVILMDIHMPVLDGIQAVRQISAEFPSTGIIMLTVFRDDDHVFAAIKAGARGYLLKDIEEETVIQAIYTINRGEALIDSNVASQVLNEFRRLSEARHSKEENELQQLAPIEMDILKLIAQGEDNQAIAQRLNLSEKTVVNRLTVIYQKLHINNRTQAALFALRQRLTPLHPNQDP